MKNVNFAAGYRKKGSTKGQKRWHIISLGLLLLALLSILFFSETLTLYNRWFAQISKVINPSDQGEVTARHFETEPVPARRDEEKDIASKGKDLVSSELTTDEGIAGKEQGALQSDKAREGKEEGRRPDSVAEESGGGGVSTEKVKERHLEGGAPYYIQICSCIVKENADKVFNRVKDLGYLPKIRKDFGQIKMHNIYTQIFTNRSEASLVQGNLRKGGLDAVIVPLPDGRCTIQVASCYYNESARKIVERLNRLGYGGRILYEMTRSAMYAVFLDGYQSLQEAEGINQGLTRCGYNSLVLKRLTSDQL